LQEVSALEKRCLDIEWFGREESMLETARAQGGREMPRARAGIGRKRENDV